MQTLRGYLETLIIYLEKMEVECRGDPKVLDDSLLTGGELTIIVYLQQNAQSREYMRVSAGCYLSANRPRTSLPKTTTSNVDNCTKRLPTSTLNAAATSNVDSPPNATATSNVDSPPNATATSNVDSPPNATATSNVDSPPNAATSNVDSPPNTTATSNVDSPPNATATSNVDSPPNAATSNVNDRIKRLRTSPPNRTTRLQNSLPKTTTTNIGNIKRPQTSLPKATTTQAHVQQCDGKGQRAKIATRPLLPHIRQVPHDSQMPHANNTSKDARNHYRDVMEAASFASIPGLPTQPDTVEHHLIDSNWSQTQSGEVTCRQAQMAKIEEIVNRKMLLEGNNVHGKLSMSSLYICFARFMRKVLEEKHLASLSARKRPSRGKKKDGRWDFVKGDLTAALDDILSTQPNKSNALSSMKMIHEGKEAQRTRNQELRIEALYMWNLGRKLCLFAESAGSAALLFLILGPPSEANYSVTKRIKSTKLSYSDFTVGSMKIFQHDRHVFTAMADSRCDHWRLLMEAHGIPIEKTLDLRRVNLHDRFFRSAFNEGTSTYRVEVFLPEVSCNYIANRIVEDHTGDILQYRDHSEHHKPWCRRFPCCAIWTHYPPIQVFETEILKLGKALRATQYLDSGDYIAEHAGSCKPDGNKDDRMRLKRSRGHEYIYQGKFWNETKFINHSDKPNIEWVEEKVNKNVRMLLRVIDGCSIWPGEELTVNYGEDYWKDKEIHNGLRFRFR